MDTKQIIVIRKDLKMRRGKECAQASHASMAFLTNQIKSYGCKQNMDWANYEIQLKEAEFDWINNSFTKVVCQVDSVDDLFDLERAARNNNIEFHMITDNGLTEFNGKPTITCCAIGPDYNDKIDKICRHLKLY